MQYILGLTTTHDILHSHSARTLSRLPFANYCWLIQHKARDIYARETVNFTMMQKD